MADSDKKRRRKRWIICGIIVAVLVAAYAGFRLYPRWQEGRCLAKLRAAGYPVTLDELDAWYEDVPPGENAALLILKAADLRVDGPPGATSVLFFSAERDLRFPTPGLPLPAKVLADTSAFVTANSPALTLLHRAASLKRGQVPADPGNTLGQNRRAVRSMNSAKLLCLEAMVNAETSRPAEAVQSFCAMMALARHCSSEPTWSGSLALSGCVSISRSGFERVLSRCTPDDAQLRSLLDAVDAAVHPDCLSRELVGEFCQSLSDYASPVRYFSEECHDKGVVFSAMVTALSLSGRFDRDRLYFVQRMNELIPACKQPLPARLRAVEQIKQRVRQDMTKVGGRLGGSLNPADPYPFSGAELDRCWAMVRMDVENIELLSAMRAALVIERFRLKSGRLPDKLVELAPEFVVAAPEDPFDGQPIRYKKLARGYVVYSVGANGQDDGGSSKPDIETGAQYLDICVTVER